MDEAMDNIPTVYSVGHSTLPYEQFLNLLQRAGVTAIADVRSEPYSRNFPQFNQNEIRTKLKSDDIAYVFLGKELGGRPKDQTFFCNGIADYEKMAAAPTFEQGLQRVIEGAQRYRIALMCSEQNPLDCHRCLLVGRALKTRGIPVTHILPSGQTRSQASIEDELLGLASQNPTQADFFASPEDLLAQAYRNRARRIAFSEGKAERLIVTAAE